MSKITERRQRTATAEIENRAILPESNEKAVTYPSKKVLLVLLIITAVISLFLLVVNAWVDSYASAFAPVDIDNAGATVTLDQLPADRQEFYNTLEQKMAEKERLSAGYKAAMDNYTVASSNIKWAEGVYNYVFYSVNDVASPYDTIGTIVLASINTNTSKISYSVINRSTLVYITSVGEGENKKPIVGPLFDAYLWGGEALITRAIQDNFGIEINGFVSVGYSEVSSMVDAFGGIEIENMSAEVLSATNKLIDELNVLEQYAGIESVTLDGTKAHLSGMQTVAYIKSREAVENSSILDTTKALMGSIVRGGIGNMVKALDIAKASIKGSIPRYDFGALLQHAITTGASLDKNIETGRATVKYFVGDVTTCEYTAERTALLDMIYPPKAEK